MIDNPYWMEAYNERDEEIDRELKLLRHDVATLKVGEKLIMTQLDDLNAALDTDFASLASAAQAMQTELNGLQDQINAGASPTDLTAQIARAQALAAQITAVASEAPTNAPAPAPADTTTTPTTNP